MERSGQRVQEVMDAYGNLHKKHASDEYDRAIACGPQYMRSCPLNSIRLMVPLESRTTWFTTDHVSSGHLKLNPYEEDRVIQISQATGPCFLAHSLMKVNNEIEGDKQCLPKDEFYPVMHKMFSQKNFMGKQFQFFGRANFRAFVLEWTESILSDFGDVLRQADIYRAVAVS
ncbi:PREDICTED: LOC109949962, partial [Prunus dulcis]